jgi:hypothetical protein
MIRGSTGTITNGPLVPGDVLSCLEELGIEVVKLVHSEAWALCPSTDHDNVHPDKWSVNMDSGFHSCFSCGFQGSFAKIVMEVKGYDYSDAAQWVRNRGGFERLRRGVESASHGFEQEEQPAVRGWNESRLALFTGPPAQARDGRRVSAGSVTHYGVRWDAENDYWILPIRDPDSFELWGYQEKGQGHFRNKPYGVTKSETLFGIDCFNSRIAIVQESPLDCLRIHSAGVGGAVSTFGVKISDIQLELLFDIADTVIFGLDNDDAGIRMSLALKEKYRRSGRNIRFLNYSHIPHAKDLGTEGVTDKDIQRAVLSSESLVLFNP